MTSLFIHSFVCRIFYPYSIQGYYWATPDFNLHKDLWLRESPSMEMILFYRWTEGSQLKEYGAVGAMRVWAAHLWDMHTHHCGIDPPFPQKFTKHSHPLPMHVPPVLSTTVIIGTIMLKKEFKVWHNLWGTGPTVGSGWGGLECIHVHYCDIVITRK